MYIRWLNTPFVDVMKEYEVCNITKIKCVFSSDHYLVSMDAAKCVIRQRSI
jgi:hypothetical protein